MPGWSRSTADLRLYYVTDAPLSADRGLLETALMAVCGGATMVQLRDPNASVEQLTKQARALVAALHPAGIPVIVNDRPEVALAVGAAGCHVGQGDMPPEKVRAMLGPDAIVGLSITDVRQVEMVPWAAIDHLGVGPVVSKGVKADAAEPMGFAGLEACVRRARKPVVAIGGMTVEAVPQAIGAGARGIAAVAAIAGADDPEDAAMALRTAIDHHIALRARQAA
jgi:thiamine-phosphate pyrophosphorylase